MALKVTKPKIETLEALFAEYIGKKVIARSDTSGCWHGTVKFISRDPQGNFTIAFESDARRLWKWWSPEGVSLSGVAVNGLRPDKLDECYIALPVVAVAAGCCEFLITTPKANKSIESCPVQ